jgi:hypothetical protein
MTDFTPIMNVSFPGEGKRKEITGPRVETIALIRQFARFYNADYSAQQKVYKRLIN